MSDAVVVNRWPPVLLMLVGVTLRARHPLVEINDVDLRLSRAESRALAEGEGLRLTDDDLTALMRRTEGWAAGTYLAAAALRSAQPSAAGAGDPLGEYLRDEVLRSLPVADQTFLVRTSVLDRLSAPLCDAVLNAEGSYDDLRRLADANVLLTRLDENSGWFRLNPAFVHALRQELVRRDPALSKMLHARASQWLADNGDPDGAVEHALAAGDVPRLARLVWDRVPDCLDRGRVDCLADWLRRIDARQVMAHAKLALAAGWSELIRGRPAEHWIGAAERGHYDARRKGEAAAVASGAALLRALVGRNGFAQMGSDARLAAELDDHDAHWLITAHVIDGVSSHLRGDRDEAGSRFLELEHQATSIGAHHARTLGLAELALLALEDDDWSAATRFADLAAGCARTHRLEAHATLVMVHGLAAATRARAGHTDEAQRLARRCLVSLATTAQAPTWVGVQCRQALARMYLELGEAAAARTVLSEAQSMLVGIDDAESLRQSLARLWRRLETFPLEPELGASTLTTAELRIVQLLPTNLSFEAIGRQLFISRNTVKTEAVSAYRKLGARSRSEAVERAQGLGLITGDLTR